MKKNQILLIMAAGFFIIIGLAVKQALSPPVFPLFHGPHLSEALYQAGINEAEVLGWKSRRSKSRLKPTPSTPFRASPTPTPTPKPAKPITTLATPTPALPTPTPTVTPSTTPIPTPTPSTPLRAGATLNQAGIAAGGGLPYLGQNELDLYFSQLKELGVSWVRWDFDWGVIQADGPAGFDWSGTDRVVQTAVKYGINTLGIITYTPKWAQQAVCAGTFACAPADPALFGKFAGEVASRYAPQGIHHWEIWNEPNYNLFWKPFPDVTGYITILEAAHMRIKESDQKSVVLIGGLAVVGNEDNNIATTTFIDALYKSNPTKNFDAIAIHPYTYPALASYPASWNTWHQIESIRQLMINHGDGDKLIWITEYGVPTNGPGTLHDTTQLENFIYGSDYMTENSQAMIADDVLSLLPQMKDYLGPFFWYSLKDNGTSKDTPENFFGLLRFDGSKKPAYYKFKSAIESSR